MHLSNFSINLDEDLYQAALNQAQSEGKTLDQALADLLTAYAQKAGEQTQTYTVQRGDTLSKLAQNFYGDAHRYQLIQKANNIAEANRIWVGQVLVIPPLSEVTAPVSQPTTPSSTIPQPTSSPQPISPRPPTPAPTPVSPPTSKPSPTPQPESAPQPTSAKPQLLNGSFDDYQPYMIYNEAKFWKEARFPEEYGSHWSLVPIQEGEGRFHVMNSGVFGQFTKKYFGGSGLDYHQHGRYSQVIASRYNFDIVFKQTVAAQAGRDYTFSGMIVSFYKGTAGDRKDGIIFKTIGIDPTGGTEWNSPTVIWGERDGKDNAWRYPKLTARAQARAITIFIRLENIEKDVGETELNIIHLEKFKLRH